MPKTKAALLLLGFISLGCNKPPQGPPPGPIQEATSSKYHSGEEYSFSGRPGDEDPRFLVLKVDFQQKLGNIVHLRISGIRLKNPKATNGYFEKILDFPIEEASLDQSGPKLIKSGVPVPDFKEAYQEWRKSFDEGKSGIWKNPLAQCLQSMEKASNP